MKKQPEKIVVPKESFLAPALSCGQYLFEGLGIFVPFFNIPAVILSVSSEVVASRNLKIFGLAVKQIQNAIFDYTNLSEDVKAIFLTNFVNILNDVVKTASKEKIELYANLFMEGIKKKTILCSDSTFEDYRQMLGELPINSVRLLVNMDGSTIWDKDIPKPFDFRDSDKAKTGISFEGINRFYLYKAMSIGLVLSSNVTFDEGKGTLNLTDEDPSFRLSPLYFNVKKYFLSSEKENSTAFDK